MGSTGKRRLSELQQAAILILAQPKRGGMSYIQVADAVGVHRDTLQNWRKRDDFNDELKAQVMRNTLDRFPEIMESIPDHIIKEGNAAMFRTFLQAHNMLTEKVELDSKQSQAIDVDSIMERLSSTGNKTDE